jgi:hypothetical protein
MKASGLSYSMHSAGTTVGSFPSSLSPDPGAETYLLHHELEESISLLSLLILMVK